MIKNSFYKKLTFEKFIDAHYRARKNKTSRKELLKFEVDLESNIVNIMNSLINGNYNLGKYRVFIVYEPKERIIKCLPYIDRIVQQWYIYEFIKPYIIPRLISTTCACIDQRGTHYAVSKTQEYMRKMRQEYHNYYIIKLDIKKYFYNIDKDILCGIMTKYIKDKKLLWLTKIFIYDSSDKLGIPIGNYTSQYFANIYLDKLDKYIKQDLRIKYYVRYMDDMVILVRNKEECMVIMNNIKDYILRNLNLELNEKSRYYPNKLGVNFCGYIIYEDYKLMRKNSKKKIKNRIKLWRKLNKKNKLDKKRLLLSYKSWIGHAKHADSYRYRNKINKLIKDITSSPLGIK